MRKMKLCQSNWKQHFYLSASAVLSESYRAFLKGVGGFEGFVLKMAELNGAKSLLVEERVAFSNAGNSEHFWQFFIGVVSCRFRLGSL